MAPPSWRVEFLPIDDGARLGLALVVEGDRYGCGVDDWDPDATAEALECMAGFAEAFIAIVPKPPWNGETLDAGEVRRGAFERIRDALHDGAVDREEYERRIAERARG